MRVNALFSFLKPGPSPKQKQLVSELLEVCRLPKPQAEDVERLVRPLSPPESLI